MAPSIFLQEYHKASCLEKKRNESKEKNKIKWSVEYLLNPRKSSKNSVGRPRG
jgi:hypothetical protein